MSFAPTKYLLDTMVLLKYYDVIVVALTSLEDRITRSIIHRPACSLKLVTRTPLTSLPSNHFEVEAILKHRPITPVPQNNSEYFVKWKGHDVSQCSWVHTKDFDGNAIISAYFKQLRKGSVALTKD
jgi:hypothetical protein